MAEKTAVTVMGGVCRYCGCTQEKACRLSIGGVLSGCWWVDLAHTVCSATPCYMQFQQDQKAKRQLVAAQISNAAGRKFWPGRIGGIHS